MMHILHNIFIGLLTTLGCIVLAAIIMLIFYVIYEAVKEMKVPEDEQ